AFRTSRSHSCCVTVGKSPANTIIVSVIDIPSTGYVVSPIPVDPAVARDGLKEDSIITLSLF
ncbi:MAG: hypothetical protein FWF43_08880, partial [Propionibacteriaceae bacterium]|nr:hypothetical protein [Propionibacteriaceae bacterium]